MIQQRGNPYQNYSYNAQKVVAHLARLCADAGRPFAAVVGSLGAGAPPLPGMVHVCDSSDDRSPLRRWIVPSLSTFNIRPIGGFAMATGNW